MSELQTSAEIKNSELKIIREVNIQAEIFYLQAVQLGDHAAYTLQKSHRAQMTGLENLAESSFKTSDIFDYIKRQTARYEYWRKPFPSTGPEGSTIPLGERLRIYLEQDMSTIRNKVCHKIGIGDQTDDEQQLRRHIYLLLIRQFIRHMVVEYEYRVSFTKEA